ncbi:LysR family transcriptional regulator [Burkholderia sp. Bp8994]|uniref:immunity 52 family protein n=1 Tax=unclassified Burkholderia TaxID=2613784 RepID=UPI000F5ADE08|nr:MULTISPECIES: immunity 52 family protein [unclassified Burkholderia]RQR92992.1 LysR family transcriptional regulator [Burkholderia sp. Bp8994]RQS36967.1 LysR family transcriptional regulator [Burkholderia sp. Bp8990]
MKITSRFRDPLHDASDLPVVFEQLGSVAKAIHAHAPKFAEWFLTGDSKEEARLYPAFEDWKPTVAALAVLRTEFEGAEHRPQIISLWDGDDDQRTGATLTYLVATKERPKKIEADFNDEHVLSADQAAAVIEAVVQYTAPAYVTVEPQGYVDKQVFDDKPGVGWMLYLPKVITQQQVPEARALIPVPASGKQTGTIVVSVIDGPFSIDNPEHVEVANRIEIRLVDQDLLPTYASV